MTRPRSSATDPRKRLVAALVDRDFPRLTAVLTADARMRALIPPGLVEVSGAEAIAATFASWFGDAEELELVRSGSDTVGDRLHVFYRLRVKKPNGVRKIVEQHLLCEIDGQRLTAFDLVCTGFRPTKEDDMHVRNTIKVGLAVGLGGLALAAPLAQAGTRPNDRAGILGVGTQQVADTSDVISRYLARHPATHRPDDRAGIRGVEEAAIVAAASSQSKTFWSAGELAGTGAVAVLLALVAFAVSRRRRSPGAALQS